MMPEGVLTLPAKVAKVNAPKATLAPTFLNPVLSCLSLL